jgi:hypothetical protein
VGYIYPENKKENLQFRFREQRAAWLPHCASIFLRPPFITIHLALLLGVDQWGSMEWPIT